MLDFIVIIFIFYIIYKKYNHNSETKLTTTLQNKGFRNITTIRRNTSSTWITANLHGDNYLFEVMKNGSNVTNSSINTLMEYVTKAHFHNAILVPGNAAISNTAKSAIEQYHIEIWDNSKLISFSNSSTEDIASMIKPKITNDTCPIPKADDPIQDGKKANSILGNFFNNKVEKL